jgi:hypothetical protein
MKTRKRKLPKRPPSQEQQQEKTTMHTYQFTAFRNERYAASGEVRAESPEEAKAKIIERYPTRGLNSAITWMAESRITSC